MMSTSDYLKDRIIDRALDQLDDEKSFGIALISFAKTIVDRPENWNKIKDSFAGHAADLQIRVVLRELRLWCSRIWESNGDSLPIVARRIVNKAEAIYAARKAAHPDWPEDFLGEPSLNASIRDFCREVAETANSEIVKKLRVTRDENFAHLLRGLSGARRLVGDRFDPDSYSWNEVLQLAKRTVQLISQVNLIWRFHSHDDDGTFRVYTKYCEKYWDLLPNFSDAERKSQLKGNA